MANWVNTVTGIIKPCDWADGHCSNCGFEYDDAFRSYYKYGIPGNFCPKCGELMDNGQDDIVETCIQHHYNMKKCENCASYDNDSGQCGRLKVIMGTMHICYRYSFAEGFNICESCSKRATCSYSKTL